MTSPLVRLSELGIELPPVVAPLAAYVPAVRTGSLVYTSGQVPFVDGKLPASGKVGAEVSPEQAVDLARTCALNALAAVHALVGHPAVINGASDLLGEIFGNAGAHARSAIGVAALPLDAPVEVELIVEV